MKKNISVYTIFIITLALGIFTNNALLNMLLYNQNFNMLSFMDNLDEKSISINIIVASCLILALSGIVSYIFSKLYKKVVYSKLNTVDNEKKKKVKYTLLFITIVTYLIANVFVFVGYNEYVNEVKEKTAYLIQEYQLEDYTKLYASETLVYLFASYLNLPGISEYSFFTFLLSMIPTVLVYKNLFLKKERKKVSIILRNLTLIVSLTICVLINGYYYINIPEFDYCYFFEDGNVVVVAYSDNRKNLREEEVVVPDKVWGKEISMVSSKYSYFWLVPNKKIILPNTLKWDTFFRKDYGIYCIWNNEVIMHGEPKEWYIKDNLAYNVDGVEAFLLQGYEERINIPANVEKITNGIRYLIMRDVWTEVDEENPYFVSYDGIMYVDRVERIGSGDEAESETDENQCWIGIIPSDRNEIKMPELLEEQIFIMGMSREKVKIVLPNIKFKSIFIELEDFEFEVEAENQFYSYENGILYDKDKTKIINITPQVYNGMEIIETVQNIEENVLNELTSKYIKVIVSENNPYIESVENGIIKYK